MVSAEPESTRRLDREVLARGLVDSRSRAATLIRAGAVLVDGARITRPAAPVRADEVIEIALDGTGDEPTGDAASIARGDVGRGAVKLEHALETWGEEGADDGLDVTGRRCLDVGASTGGFTQVLLRHGAAEVTALDVGHGQLHPSLVADPRVVERSGTSIRDVTAADLGGAFDVVVGDLSFISLSLVLPVLSSLVVPGADLVLLVKPQFEVGRDRLGRGGVVRDPRERGRVLTELDELADTLGFAPVDLIRSPVTGGTGNVEYLWWLRARRSDVMDWAPDRHIRRDRIVRLIEEES